VLLLLLRFCCSSVLARETERRGRQGVLVRLNIFYIMVINVINGLWY
jgi:hypothetical protein